MSQNTINTILKLKRGSASNWNTKNPVLADGEAGYDKTNNILKIGDGTTEWNNLLNVIGKSEPQEISETEVDNLAVGTTPINKDINKFYHYKINSTGVEYLVYLPSLWVQYRFSINGIEHRNRSGVYSSSAWEIDWRKIPKEWLVPNSITGNEIAAHSIGIDQLSSSIKNDLVTEPTQFSQNSLDGNGSTFTGYWSLGGSKYCHILGKINISNNYSSDPWYINFNLPVATTGQYPNPIMSYGYLGWNDPSSSETKRGMLYLINTFDNRNVLSLTNPNNGQGITSRNETIYVDFTYNLE